ncbi:hypothetical protein [Antarctobacter heliothermus]|uniref:Uncharacterized protein n=1 Tax=Antarctobacter heliothermus TaxID=74033 RepID=A0A239EDP3_9RHOB|nr:hypothetical protein [Antarctobacter heliothermus]SNS42012.1 hypothetical protein SAMN04488078_101452 [Antarctobacter heliothermus]
MTAPVGTPPYYRFRSQARYSRARADLLGWYLTFRQTDTDEPFDLAVFSAGVPADSPLLMALEHRPEEAQPETLGAALAYLRVCLQLAEQHWPPAESFEAALAATRTSGAAGGSASETVAAPPLPPPEPADLSPPPPPQPRRRHPLRRALRGLILLALLVAACWGGGRLLQTTVERRAMAADLHRPLPAFVSALSGLSLSLPGFASACLGTAPDNCRKSDPAQPYATPLHADLARARSASSRMLAALAPLAPEDGADWIVATPAQNCRVGGGDTLEDDWRLVSSLCRVRERLTEYELCLVGHPMISDRQCADLMRLAMADTAFDCTDCPPRPANVFDPRLEWTRESRVAAGLVLEVRRFAAPDPILRLTWTRLTGDYLWLRAEALRHYAALSD